jgi:hypothetical protein
MDVTGQCSGAMGCVEGDEASKRCYPSLASCLPEFVGRRRPRGVTWHRRSRTLTQAVRADCRLDRLGGRLRRQSSPRVLRARWRTRGSRMMSDGAGARLLWGVS